MEVLCTFMPLTSVQRFYNVRGNELKVVRDGILKEGKLKNILCVIHLDFQHSEDHNYISKIIRASGKEKK